MENEELVPARVPDVLFQYCGESAIGIFEESRIKSSTPSTLNDPFEWKPCVDEQVTPEQIWNTITRLHRKDPLPVPPSLNVVAKMKSNVADAAQRHQAQFRADLELRTRIICLSQRDDGILMWAHYADRHKGFVVGFRSDLLRRGLPHSEFFKVRYGIERPMVPHPYVAPPGRDQLIPAVTQKSLEWKYEEEWRLLVDVAHLRKDENPANPNLYLPILPEAIHQVIFGSRCPEGLTSRIENVIANRPALRSVERFRARLDPKFFKIRIKKVS
jgi:hypothetical protein